MPKVDIQNTKALKSMEEAIAKSQALSHFEKAMAKTSVARSPASFGQVRWWDGL